MFVNKQQLKAYEKEQELLDKNLEELTCGECMFKFIAEKVLKARKNAGHNDLLWYLNAIEKELSKHNTPASNIMNIISHIQYEVGNLIDGKDGRPAVGDVLSKQEAKGVIESPSPASEKRAIRDMEQIYFKNGVVFFEGSEIYKALHLAFYYHARQKRRNGDPYITHPIRVAQKFKTPKEICVALLHDILEDTRCTEFILKKEGMSAEIITAIKELSRKKGETYFDFIGRITNPIAIKVKIADLEDNMSDLEEGHQKDKYRFAHHILIVN